MKSWKVYVLIITSLLFYGCNSSNNPSPTPPPATQVTVSAAVQTVITDNCVRCHAGDAPASHTDQVAGGNDSGVCGICHVPFNWTAAMNSPTEHSSFGNTTDCTICHSTVAGTHFFLRDDTDQTALNLATEADGATAHGQGLGCYSCHLNNQGQTAARTALGVEGRGYPSLATDAAIIAAAENGTLRSWIQEGGFMAKYLTPAEATTITDWVDANWTDTRTLGYDPYLDATPITTDFDINDLFTGTDNAAWDGATEHLVALDPTVYTAADQLKLKALYSDTYLYLRAEYPDSTASLTRASSWVLDTGTWRHPNAATGNDKQSEDRLAFFWNMAAPDYKARLGCAISCHGDVPGSAKFTNDSTFTPETTMDIWHEKAARGIGVLGATDAGLVVNTVGEAFEATAGTLSLKGYVDDKRLINFMDTTGGFDTEDSGRRSDSGVSAYSHNRNGDKSAPKFIEIAPDSYADAMNLTEAETLDTTQTIVADPAATGYVATAVATAWANYSALDALVPERILRVSTGSRGDVTASAVWKDGIWTLEFKRLLDTGDAANDVIFSPATKAENDFSVAVFDNCGRGEMPPGHTTYGDNQYQILRFLP